MAVYADVLIVLNLITDYFLLRLTARLVREEPSFRRTMLAAAAGGLSSLTIFLPELPVPAELLLRIALCGGLTLVCFGFHSLRRFLRAGAVLFGVTCGYAGVMLAVWMLLHPPGMAIRNSVVYFSFSPLVLIGFSVGIYLAVNLARRLLSRQAPLAARCEVRLFAGDRTTCVTAIADTGNSLEDPMTGGEIIIADACAFEALFGGEAPSGLRRRYRALPCVTVSGEELLDGYRCDRATVRCGDRLVELSRPVLAVSKAPIRGDYSAVINPKILER